MVAIVSLIFIYLVSSLLFGTKFSIKITKILWFISFIICSISLISGIKSIAQENAEVEK